MEYETTCEAHTIKLHMRDHCTFANLQSFEHVMGEIEQKDYHTIELDMESLDHIDSSGLGLLLMLREKATAKNIPVVLSKPKDSVRRILEATRLTTLFEVA